MRLEEIGDSNIVLKIYEEKHEIVLFFALFEIKIPSQLCGKYSFAVNQSLSREEIMNLLNNIQLFIIKEKIKSKIIKKLYTEHEVTEVIKNRGFAGDFADCVVKQLRNEGLLDDPNYVKLVLETLNNELYGKYYIINYFKIKGISDELISKINFNDECELEKAKKYFESIQNLFVSSNFAKQKKKIYDDMVKRGFTVDIILKVLNGLKIDQSIENERLKKDYEKAYARLSKTYSGYKLDTKIVNYLINIGYDYDKILKLFSKEDE